MDDYDAARRVVLDRAFDAPDLEYLLEITAGTKNTLPFYRPWYVAAQLWSTAKNTRRLFMGKGAQFDRVGETVSGLLELQRKADAGAEIPVAYQVRFATQTLKTTSVPTSLTF